MTDVKIGDVVNVLADYDTQSEAWTVDDINGMIIVDPDHLISGTSIVSSLFCMRKAVLNEIFKGTEGDFIEFLFENLNLNVVLLDFRRVKNHVCWYFAS